MQCRLSGSGDDHNDVSEKNDWRSGLWIIVSEKSGGIGLLVISCAALILAICNLTSAQLPDMVQRILGAICLLTLPVLVYTSVKLRIWETHDDQ